MCCNRHPEEAAIMRCVQCSDGSVREYSEAVLDCHIVKPASRLCTSCTEKSPYNVKKEIMKGFPMGDIFRTFIHHHHEQPPHLLSPTAAIWMARVAVCQPIGSTSDMISAKTNNKKSAAWNQFLRSTCGFSQEQLPAKSSAPMVAETWMSQSLASRNMAVIDVNKCAECSSEAWGNRRGSTRQHCSYVKSPCNLPREIYTASGLPYGIFTPPSVVVFNVVLEDSQDRAQTQQSRCTLNTCSDSARWRRR